MKKRDIDLVLKKVNLFEELGEERQTKNCTLLSEGQKQRVCLARTFFDQKPVVFLDEPFADLDLENRIALQNKIFDDKLTTYVIVTHHLDESQNNFDQVIRLYKEEADV